MNRFQKCLILAILATVVAAVFLRGSARWIVIGGVLTLMIALFSVGMATIRLRFFVPVICRGEPGQPGQRRIALTFDDGPDPAATPALLDLLANEKIPAAFFCIGQRVSEHPEIAKRIVADGHLLENHSQFHSWSLMFNRSAGLIREFGAAQRAIERAAGVTPRFLRPPVGLTNPHFPKAIKQLNLTLIGWDVRPMDTMRTAADVITRVLNQATDGSIIVLHDGGSTAEHITQIVSQLAGEFRSRGFAFERVDRMIKGL